MLFFEHLRLWCLTGWLSILSADVSLGLSATNVTENVSFFCLEKTQSYFWSLTSTSSNTFPGQSSSLVPPPQRHLSWTPAMCLLCLGSCPQLRLSFYLPESSIVQTNVSPLLTMILHLHGPVSQSIQGSATIIQGSHLYIALSLIQLNKLSDL